MSINKHAIFVYRMWKCNWEEKSAENMYLY